ncbi:MAG: hypothetical protein SCARUB_03057 [Candidatus Scalindua rubra]|uniref:Uncharacterized protein n=1 Tax=Candidatus Scalindua rubra TaxID=1872076 RepID=A0A1E3X8A9_9BACT|nr:MAG: hypothetical protein SCARUB_03057 [Candidatus Scalindua rubra]
MLAQGKITMGMFNSIYADLLCPTMKKLSKDTEIQIKWQDYRVRTLTHYRRGDVLEEIEDEYDNTWIRTGFICNVCSKHTKGWKGMEYIKNEDQSRHKIFVKIEDGKICEIFSEEDFSKIGVKDFVDYL